MRTANPKAAREDRVVYDRLFSLTTVAAQPLIRAAMEETTSEEATKELAGQLGELRAFLLDHPPSPIEGNLAASLAGFGPELRESLAQGPDSEELYRDLTREFSTVLWGALLRQMRLGTQAKGSVARRDLLPAEDASDERWQDVYLAVDQYGLGQQQVVSVLKKVFGQLASEESGDRIRLPLGLSVDKAMLVRALERQPEPPEPNDLMRLLRAAVEFVTPSSR